VDECRTVTRREMLSWKDSRRPRFSPLTPFSFAVRYESLQYCVATDIRLRGEQLWQLSQRVRDVRCCKMGLLSCGPGPFFDNREVGRICSVLQQLVAEAPGLSAGWLDAPI
jgi:hypothetical protein